MEMRSSPKRRRSRLHLRPWCLGEKMIYGAYGSGKTQTLYYLTYELGLNPSPSCNAKPHAPYLDIEAQNKSMAD